MCCNKLVDKMKVNPKSVVSKLHPIAGVPSATWPLRSSGNSASLVLSGRESEVISQIEPNPFCVQSLGISCGCLISTFLKVV